MATILQNILGVDKSLPENERGQAVVNRIFGASPDNPVELPVKSIPVRVSLEYDTQIIILSGFAVIGIAWIIGSYIKSK